MHWFSRRARRTGRGGPSAADRPDRPARAAQTRRRPVAVPVAPLSVSRLAAALDRNGWNYRQREDSEDFIGHWDDDIVVFMLCGEDRQTLNVLGYMWENFGVSRLDEVRFAIDEWHRSRLWPSCFWHDNEEPRGTFSVGAAVGAVWSSGVTDDQLDHYLASGVAAIGSAFEDVRDRLGVGVRGDF